MLRPALLSLTLLFAPLSLSAQGEEDLIRQHFASLPWGGEALISAQQLLAISGHDLQPTGTWDAATRAAFAASIETMRTIGFSGLDTNDPFELTRIVIDWHLGALRSELGLQEFPD